MACYENAASESMLYTSSFPTPFRNAQTRQLSHPLPVLRAKEIDEWSRSQEYQSLLKRLKWVSVSSVQTV